MSESNKRERVGVGGEGRDKGGESWGFSSAMDTRDDSAPDSSSVSTRFGVGTLGGLSSRNDETEFLENRNADMGGGAAVVVVVVVVVESAAGGGDASLLVEARGVGDRRKLLKNPRARCV